MRLTAITLFALSLNVFVAIAQEKQVLENPFDKLGYNPLVATSSRGEFAEFHDQADIVEIGSVLFNTKTNEVVKILKDGETTIDLSSATSAMSIDPLCEKYYWISPYVYCLNNPIRFIDPDGRDVWELDEKGNILNMMTHDVDGNRLTFDRIDVMDKDGNLKTQTPSFELGTITQETIVNGNNSYNVFNVNGDDNAKSVFGTLGNPDSGTKVEWSHSVFGSKDGGRTNYVSTSHQGATELSITNLYNANLKAGNALLEHTHNHPVDSPYPSGIYGVINGQGGDVGYAREKIQQTEAKFSITPKFYMYDHKTGHRVPYSGSSKPSDFGIKVPK